MSNYRSDRSSGGGFGDTNSRGSTLFSTTCDECGKNCQVPFKPRGDKPVYCSECFEKKEGGSSRGSYDRGGSRDKRSDRGRGRSNFGGDREMFDAVCDKCGKDCKVPFRPSGDKPIFCSECFEQKEAGRGNSRDSSRGKSSGSGSGNNNELVAQMKRINEKLDKIITAMGVSTNKKVKKESASPEVEQPGSRTSSLLGKSSLQGTPNQVAKKVVKKVVVEKKPVSKKVAKKKSASKKTVKASSITKKVVKAKSASGGKDKKK